VNYELKIKSPVHALAFRPGQPRRWGWESSPDNFPAWNWKPGWGTERYFLKTVFSEVVVLGLLKDELLRDSATPRKIHADGIYPPQRGKDSIRDVS